MRDANPGLAESGSESAAANASAPAFPAAPPAPARPLTVAFDARKLRDSESGVGGYIVNLVRAMRRQENAPRILLVRSAWQEPAGFDEVEEVRVPYPAEVTLTPGTLRRCLRGRRFDLFHSPFDIAPRGLAEPVVVTIHDINWLVNSGYNSNNLFMRAAAGIFYRARLKDAMRVSSRIVAISRATRNAIVEYAPWHEPKIRVVPNGIDRSRIFPLPKEEAHRLIAPILAPSHPFVLTVGQGAPYKNHGNAVRAFLQAFADRPEYRMILVRRPTAGDRALARLLATREAAERVRCLAKVTPQVLNALYSQARIVLHPSYYEGFGLPLVEAMAAGTPVITSSVSSMPEVVGRAGLLVTPGDVNAIARALEALDRDELLRARLVAAGRHRLALFDWDAAAKATLGIYAEAVRSGASRRFLADS